jgi:hypothetical protein
MDRSILVDQPKQVLERSKLTIAARCILSKLGGAKFIPINLSCSFSHQGTPSLDRP